MGTTVGRRSVLLAVQQSDRRLTSSGTVSGMRLSEGRFPWSISFPPRTPLPEFRFCSSVSQVLRDRPTPRQRARRQYGHPAFTDRPIGECSPQGTAEASRFSRLEFRRMLRFSDSAVSAGVSPKATPTTWPSPYQARSARGSDDFGAGYPLGGLACQPSPRTLKPETLPFPVLRRRPKRWAKSSS